MNESLKLRLHGGEICLLSETGKGPPIMLTPIVLCLYPDGGH
jgi:hypothetical protein